MGSGESKIINKNDFIPQLGMDDTNIPDINNLTTYHEGFDIFRDRKNNNDIIQLVTILLFLLLFFMFKYI
jgi:hypothetical protein